MQQSLIKIQQSESSITVLIGKVAPFEWRILPQTRRVIIIIHESVIANEQHLRNGIIRFYTHS